MKKNTYQYKILSLLLSKYERSQTTRKGVASKQRPQFNIKNSLITDDYFDEMDFRKRESIHLALQQLVIENVVEVVWEKFQEGRKVHKVYLNLDGLETAYQLAGITPKNEKILQLRKILLPLKTHPWEWVRNWFMDTMEVLEQYKNVVGVNLEDQDTNLDLIQVLLGLPNIKGVIQKRLFSQLVLHDSKRFEQVIEKRLLSIYKRYGEVEFEKDEEYLDSLGIVEHPKQALVAGLIEFVINDVVTNVESLPGGVGLSSKTIEQLVIKNITAGRIICVENLTSYYQMIQFLYSNHIKNEDNLETTLVIYTGGFPHRTLQTLLSKIVTFLSDLCTDQLPRVYHWGDIDYGGIRIFEYIKQNFFDQLLPYKMDVTTYESYAERGITFNDAYARKLEGLLQDTKYIIWHPVIKKMLLYKKRVEQESIHLGLNEINNSISTSSKQ
ncbi:Wadjet anti-phage system protein JetD domain-containing protein [Hazenella coriacea]|uniref:DNA topoisomerase VI subunit A n=1 Tax=Hazenella coriacea TaxID=1179467 RepID=A0A4R3L9F2_9BACL|nr:Wadjet anti-phage system protein JetD domain-containing protein [Hazenella coriacea]TCS95735.1 DNA topoisomerase VI subunit A [Hazenella coriacea]